ncbi:MAG: GHKL domain-containing protein [Bdellovibrionaceae bacterium]|nr:GHKL domain-containing protein [Pseudobdellovibrionaceae bacterium]
MKTSIKAKKWLVLSSIFLILIGWALAFSIAIPTHIRPLLLLAIALPVIPTLIILWMLSHSVPDDVMKKINEITQRVVSDKEIDQVVIRTEKLPKEVLPFVNAINRLLSYHHDRFQQERDFTAHASHELRSPLAGIRLQTEIAMMTKDPIQKENALKNVIKSIDRGTRLVEQLLIISRLTNEKVDLAKERVDLKKLVQEVVSENQFSADRKQIQLIAYLQIDSLFVEASKDSLYILIDNLIRNAIKHTPTTGKVTVALPKATNDSSVMFIVEDNGPGIPAGDRDRVMKRFEKGVKGSKAGTGLGLAIVNRIVSLYGGDVQLKDARLGHGLQVVVHLPIGLLSVSEKKS